MRTLKNFIKEVKTLETKQVSSFNISGLETAIDSGDELEYLKKAFPGQPGMLGASRIVYFLDEKRVLKVELNSDYRDNRIEIENSECLKGYATQVLEHAGNSSWLIAERAIPLTDESFLPELQKITGMFWKEGIFESSLRYLALKNTPAKAYIAQDMENRYEYHSRIEAAKEAMAKSSWYKKLFEKLMQCDVNPIDLRGDNWGLLDGKLVIVDYGYGKIT